MEIHFRKIGITLFYFLFSPFSLESFMVLEFANYVLLNSPLICLKKWESFSLWSTLNLTYSNMKS